MKLVKLKIEYLFEILIQGVNICRTLYGIHGPNLKRVKHAPTRLFNLTISYILLLNLMSIIYFNGGVYTLQ